MYDTSTLNFFFLHFKWFTVPHPSDFMFWNPVLPTSIHPSLPTSLPSPLPSSLPHSLTFLPTFPLTFLLTSLPYLPPYLPTFPLTSLLTSFPTSLLTSLPTFLLTPLFLWLLSGGVRGVWKGTIRSIRVLRWCERTRSWCRTRILLQMACTARWKFTGSRYWPRYYRRFNMKMLFLHTKKSLSSSNKQINCLWRHVHLISISIRLAL